MGAGQFAQFAITAIFWGGLAIGIRWLVFVVRKERATKKFKDVLGGPIIFGIICGVLVVAGSYLTKTQEDHAPQRIHEEYQSAKAATWKFLEPLKQFQASQVSRAQLGQRTALPELAMLKSYTRMRELADQVQGNAQRQFFVDFTTELLLRHKGLIEYRDGLVAGDEQAAQGGWAKFEKHRAAAAKIVATRSRDLGLDASALEALQ